MKNKKYEKFDIVFKRVPVQFGNLSKRERQCYHLGSIGSLHQDPFIRENYYRICEDFPGAGRFFMEKRWYEIKDGVLDEQRQLWVSTYYIQYRDLPDEIKKNIEEQNLENITE